MSDAMWCELGLVELSSLIQLIETNRLSGRLSLQSSTEEVGWIDFSEGLLGDAACRGQVGPMGLYETFLWPASVAVFHAGDTTVVPEVNDLWALLIEACRLKDQWQYLHSIVLVADEPSRLVEHWPVLEPIASRFDGECTVDQAIAHASIARGPFIDPLQDALNTGQLRPTDGEHPEAHGSQAYYAALAAARHHFKLGQAAASLSAVREALALRPDDVVARQNLARIRSEYPDLFTEES